MVLNLGSDSRGVTMQAFKPGVKNEAPLATSADGKIVLTSCTLPTKDATKQGKPGILVRFVGVRPGTGYPDRYDTMSEENWGILLGGHLPSLVEAFSGIVEAKKKAEEAKKAKAKATVDTIRATGLPAVAANAAIMATLKSEGYEDTFIQDLVKASAA